MNKLFIASVLASFCAFSLSSQQQSKRKQRHQTPSPEASVSASSGATEQAITPQQTIAQQVVASPNGTVVQTNGIKPQVHIKTPKPGIQNSDAVQKQSLGTFVDALFTKFADNVWGHASNVTSDILTGSITEDADTNGLHRIDRAIDEHIAKDNQAGLIELIQACTDKNILIPVAHIKKSEDYVHDLQNKLKNMLILLSAMQSLHIDIMKSSLETTSDDDGSTITVKSITPEEKE